MIVLLLAKIQDGENCRNFCEASRHLVSVDFSDKCAFWSVVTLYNLRHVCLVRQMKCLYV